MHVLVDDTIRIALLLVLIIRIVTVRRLTATIERVTGYSTIVGDGMTGTPALVVDGTLPTGRAQ